MYVLHSENPENLNKTEDLNDRYSSLLKIEGKSRLKETERVNFKGNRLHDYIEQSLNQN